MQGQSNRVNWGRRSSHVDSHSLFRCGRLLAELHVREGEIGLSSKTLEEEELSEPAGPEVSGPRSWTQWAVCTGGDTIVLCPGLPDLPVLADLSDPFEIAPGETRRVYLRIPVTVVFQVDDQFDEILAELPSESLKRVWFGEADSGELCYHLPGALFPERPVSIDESSIQAPVTIRNESRETLEVSQLCLRLSSLGIYRLKDVLWTNETLVRFQGGKERSRVSVRSGAPAEAPNAELITAPRETNETVVGRTFRSLRDWTTELLVQG